MGRSLVTVPMSQVVTMPQGFRFPLGRWKVLHPPRGETQPPPVWLQLDNSFMISGPLTVLIANARTRREFSIRLGSSVQTVCTSWSGSEPDPEIDRPQSEHCASCPETLNCNFVHHLLAVHPDSGQAGILTLRGVSARRYETALQCVFDNHHGAVPSWPYVFRVKPEVLSFFGSTYTVPRWTYAPELRMLQEEEAAVLQGVVDRYDLRQYMRQPLLFADEPESGPESAIG